MLDAPPFSPRSKWAAASGDLLVAAFALLLVVVSFSAENPQPYLFPRILAIAMFSLALLQILIVASGGDWSVQLTTILQEARRSSLAILAVILYVALCEWLGFYTAAILAFLSIVYIGSNNWSQRQFATAVAVAAATAVVLYVLFSLLLRVQVPRGWLF